MYSIFGKEWIDSCFSLPPTPHHFAWLVNFSTSQNFCKSSAAGCYLVLHMLIEIDLSSSCQGACLHVSYSVFLHQLLTYGRCLVDIYVVPENAWRV
jgi:hypothetical protein